MRIYIQIDKLNKKSFLAADLEKKVVSTISCHPHLFFEQLNRGTFKFFTYEEQDIIKANEKEIIVKNSYFKNSKVNEKYSFAGIATNSNELNDLLNTYIKKESFFEKITKIFGF